MPRQARDIRPGYFYHVVNRSAGRIALFRRDGDFAAFEQIMLEASERCGLRIVDWCLMKNHWHFVVWPRRAEEVTEYFRWLTHTHAMRWRVSRATVGWGHLYGGRFKAFVVEEGSPLLRVRRYVQRNALVVGAVKHAEQWRWGSLWVRQSGPVELRALLSRDAPALPENWLETVNAALSAKELERLRVSMLRGRPYGADAWVGQMVKEMGLEHTIRPEGRQAKPQPTSDA